MKFKSSIRSRPPLPQHVVAEREREAMPKEIKFRKSNEFSGNNGFGGDWLMGALSVSFLSFGKKAFFRSPPFEKVGQGGFEAFLNPPKSPFSKGGLAAHITP